MFSPPESELKLEIYVDVDSEFNGEKLFSDANPFFVSSQHTFGAGCSVPRRWLCDLKSLDTFFGYDKKHPCMTTSPWTELQTGRQDVISRLNRPSESNKESAVKDLNKESAGDITLMTQWI